MQRAVELWLFYSLESVNRHILTYIKRMASNEGNSSYTMLSTANSDDRIISSEHRAFYTRANRKREIIKKDRSVTSHSQNCKYKYQTVSLTNIVARIRISHTNCVYNYYYNVDTVMSCFHCLQRLAKNFANYLSLSFVLSLTWTNSQPASKRAAPVGNDSKLLPRR